MIKKIIKNVQTNTKVKIKQICNVTKIVSKIFAYQISFKKNT